MSGLIKQTKDALASAKSIVSSIGPFLISQTEKTSDAYARHQLMMTNVEAAKTLLLAEAKSIASIRDSLRQKFLNADPEERIRIRRDLVDSESEIRQLHVAAGAVAYLPDFSSSTEQNATEVKIEEDSEPIPDHWMDRFNQFARQNNEPWRQDLLSRALAMQATNPDSVTPRALWTIGTLEKPKFDAFSAILDISCRTEKNFIIPDANGSETIPHCELGENVGIGAILFSLLDTGLMAHHAFSVIDAEENYQIAYHETGYEIVPKNRLELEGIMPSETGQSVARFYNTRRNEFGRELLTKWIKTLKSDNFTIIGPKEIKWE